MKKITIEKRLEVLSYVKLAIDQDLALQSFVLQGGIDRS